MRIAAKLALILAGLFAVGFAPIFVGAFVYLVFGVRPFPLGTDVLIYVLVVAIAAYFVYARRREHLAAPWRRVAQSASGMSALVVLAAFIAVGLLDSLHFRPALEGRDAQGNVVYAVEVRSVLDVALTRLRERTERTYSAPLAVRAYSRETVELPDGKTVRDYPRLRWGGARLKDESQRGTDIFAIVLRGFAAGLATAANRAGCAAALHRKRRAVARPRGRVRAASRGRADYGLPGTGYRLGLDQRGGHR